MTLEVLKALVVILHESRLLQELFNGPVLLENAM